MTDEQRNLMAAYIDPYTFYDAATGQINPNDIPNLVTHQPALMELPARQPRKQKPKQSKRVAMRQKVEQLGF